jgi:hypothetical protein
MSTIVRTAGPCRVAARRRRRRLRSQLIWRAAVSSGVVARPLGAELIDLCGRCRRQRSTPCWRAVFRPSQGLQRMVAPWRHCRRVAGHSTASSTGGAARPVGEDHFHSLQLTGTQRAHVWDQRGPQHLAATPRRRTTRRMCSVPVVIGRAMPRAAGSRTFLERCEWNVPRRNSDAADDSDNTARRRRDA